MLLALFGPLGLAHALDAGSLEPCPVRDSEGVEDRLFLVTVGPGEAPYSYLGHTALWVQSPARKMNHLIEYGAFDSSKQEPFTNLMRGTLSCRWKVVYAYKGQDRYEAEGRHAVGQQIDLPPDDLDTLLDQLRELAGNTKETWAPFHWRTNSCASEARDYIDAGTGNAWSNALNKAAAPMSPRDEVMRHVGLHPWAWFGLQALAGRRVDVTQTRWEAGFVPERIAQEAAAFSLTWPDGSVRPMVKEACSFNEGDKSWPLEDPPSWSLYTGLIGVLWGGLLVLLGARAATPGSPRSPRVGFGLAVAFTGFFVGLFGTVSTLLAGVSLLDAYKDNVGWIFMNPLAFGLIPAGVAWARGRRPAWARTLTQLLAAGVLLTPLLMLGAHQAWMAPWGMLGLPLLALGVFQWRQAPALPTKQSPQAP